MQTLPISLQEHYHLSSLCKCYIRMRFLLNSMFRIGKLISVRKREARLSSNHDATHSRRVRQRFTICAQARSCVSCVGASRCVMHANFQITAVFLSVWVEIVKSHPSSDPRTECAFLMSSVVFLKGPYISFLAKLRTSHPVIYSEKAGNEYAAVPRRHWLLRFDNFLQYLTVFFSYVACNSTSSGAGQRH